MNNVKGILEDYLPLNLYTLDDVGEEDMEQRDYGFTLRAEHFEWIRFSDRRKSSQAQIYDGSDQTFCPVKQRAPKAKAILNGKALRLPKISYCWPGKSLMLANELMEDIGLAPNLGIVETKADIVDAVQEKHQGYTALSMHKSFSLLRVQQRLSTLPIEQRSLINLKCHEFEGILLIHKSVLDKWQKKGISEINYHFNDRQLDLPERLKSGVHQATLGMVEYQSFADYQSAKGIYHEDA